MPKKERQKIKTLLIAKYLWEETDEEHSVSASDIVADLDVSHGIQAEEHSIYRDIAALRDVLGLSIEGGRGRGKRIHLSSHLLDYDDLRTVAECVYAARFISENHARRIIDALGIFCSKHQKAVLDRETFVYNRSRTTEKTVLQIAKTIRSAIKSKKKISFRYATTRIDNVRSTTYRRNGARYIVSPFTLLIEGGNYYLLGYSESAKDIRTYRVDRMRNVECLVELRRGEDKYFKLDIRSYTQRVFGMYGGEPQRVFMRFSNEILDPVVDRLGTEDVVYREEDSGHFIVSANIVVSPQFYAWVFGFGDHAEITGPTDVTEGMKEYLKKVFALYE